MRSLTTKDFFKYRACDLLGNDNAPTLTPGERYAQAVAAKQARNLWFTSTIYAGRPTGAAGDASAAVSITPRFAHPVILTDIISLFERELVPTRELLLTIDEYGGEGNAYGQNFFNLYGPVMSRLLVKHEKNRKAVLGAVLSYSELMGKELGFVPFMLRPFQTLKCSYQETPDTDTISNFVPSLGFRAVRPLMPGDPYREISPLAAQQIRNYINGSEPETFLMETPQTTVAALGVGAESVELVTPRQDRPLLVLGATSNIDGCQARLTDEEPYQFTFQEAPKLGTIGFPGPGYNDPPLQLFAPNQEWHNTDMACMWPVPHLLEPGHVLKIKLTSGLFPRWVSGISPFAQRTETHREQALRITFICRTV